MHGPVEESLSRFTPSPGGIDRDAILFAAGRSSARPDRKWPTLAALLALSQILTVGLLLSPGPLPPPTTPLPVPIVPSEVAPPAPTIVRDWRSALDESPVPPPGSDDLIPDEPPLRVCAANRLLNSLPANIPFLLRCQDLTMPSVSLLSATLFFA